jgi:hypothetical protein
MSSIKLHPYIDKGAIDPEEASIADRFAEIMGDISLDYDLGPDVLGAAQDVLQALKAREKGQLREPEKSEIVYM